MAAWNYELERKLMTRTVLDRRLVMYREESGKPVALIDRCPHRFAPLSRGRLVGDTVQCGYHGLAFGNTGACVRTPFPGPLPAVAKVHSFPLHERDHIVWLRAGDAAAADPALIPDFSYITQPDCKAVYGLSTMQANYEIVIDNLMDLSHVEFLHPALGGGLLEDGKHTVTQSGNSIHSNRWTPNVLNTPSLEMWWPTHGRRIDHSFDMRWDAPSSLYLAVGATLTGEPREAGFTLPSAHILTPQTATSTHYFWHGALPREHPQSLDDLRSIFTTAFDQEDAPMLEAIQREMGDNDFWSLNPVMLKTDTGGIRARRVLAKLIEAERAGDDLATRRAS